VIIQIKNNIPKDQLYILHSSTRTWGLNDSEGYKIFRVRLFTSNEFFNFLVEIYLSNLSTTSDPCILGDIEIDWKGEIWKLESRTRVRSSLDDESVIVAIGGFGSSHDSDEFAFLINSFRRGLYPDDTMKKYIEKYHPDLRAIGGQFFKINVRELFNSFDRKWRELSSAGLIHPTNDVIAELLNLVKFKDGGEEFEKIIIVEGDGISTKEIQVQYTP
jgi:hypothetical protein